MQEDNPFDEAKIWEFSLQISRSLIRKKYQFLYKKRKKNLISKIKN